MWPLVFHPTVISISVGLSSMGSLCFQFNRSQRKENLVHWSEEFLHLINISHENNMHLLTSRGLLYFSSSDTANPFPVLQLLRDVAISCPQA